MRFAPLLLLAFAGLAQATSVMEVTVIEGTQVPVKYRFDMDGSRHELDLRDSHRYNAAFNDPATKKDICRESEYRTGLILTLRDMPEYAGAERQIELVGQVSKLKSLTPGSTLSCGQNTVVDMENKAFPEITVVKQNRTKVLVIDNSWTVFISVKD